MFKIWLEYQGRGVEIIYEKIRDVDDGWGYDYCIYCYYSNCDDVEIFVVECGNVFFVVCYNWVWFVGFF